MCLTKINKTEYLPEYAFAYKIFAKNKQHILESPVYTYTFPEIGVWYKAGQIEIKTSKVRYQGGFHVIKSYEDAQKYLAAAKRIASSACFVIRKVEVRNITAIGIEENEVAEGKIEVIVAEEMRICA